MEGSLILLSNCFGVIRCLWLNTAITSNYFLTLKAYPQFHRPPSAAIVRPNPCNG
jgi:hypothetical protein